MPTPQAPAEHRADMPFSYFQLFLPFFCVNQCECQSCGWKRIIFGTQCCILSATPDGLAPDKAVCQGFLPCFLIVRNIT